MNRGPTFKLLGVPVRVELTFLLTGVFLALNQIEHRDNPVFWFFEVFVVLGGSILLHEFGHAMAYRRYGQQPAVVLWGLGGLAYGEYLLPPKKRIVVSMAGPLSELFLLGLPAWVIREVFFANPFQNLTLWYVLSDIIVLNIFWAIINLLPLLPLDGGNICEAAFEIYYDEPRVQTVRLISMVTATGVMVYAWLAAHSSFMFLFGVVLFVLNLIPYLRVRNGIERLGGFSLRSIVPDRPEDQLDERQSGRRKGDNVVSMDSARKKRDKRSPSELVSDGFDALERRDYKAALRIVDRLRDKRRSAELDRWIAEIAAFAWVGERNPVKAEEVLAELTKGQPSPPVTAVLALANKDLDAAMRQMIRTMISEPESGAKLVAVDLFAELGMTHRLARELVDLEGGSGFEAAVALESMLHRLHRTQDASTVSDVIMLG